MEKDNTKSAVDIPKELSTPVLPLRDVVVYPFMVIPLFVGREKSIKALEAAIETNQQILLVAQKNPAQDDPQLEDIYGIGTLANILQLLKLPDGTVKVLVEGSERARIRCYTDTHEYFCAQVLSYGNQEEADRETEVLTRSLLNQFEQYVKLNKKVPPEILSSLSSIDDSGRLADTIAAHMALKIEEKQAILEIDKVRARLEHLLGLLESEIDILQVEKRIRGRVKRQMEKVFGFRERPEDPPGTG
jgi:ATP-dependent Lon protease